MVFIQSLIDGILMGSVYALAALGVSLIFGVMTIPNFAHGALMMLGMYLTYEFVQATGLVLYVALPAVVVIMFLIGYAIQRFFIGNISVQNNKLLFALGLSTVIENSALMIWTATYKKVTVPGWSKALAVGGLTVNKPKLVAFFLVIIFTVLVYIFLYRTNTGKAIRATSMDKTGATLVGIGITKINAIAFGVGTICAGVAGTLLVPTTYLTPSIGNNYQLMCFVIAVFGGMGNVWGAMVAGLIIGVVQSVGSLVLGGSWSNILVYMIFVLTLLLKPTGLFGKDGRHG